jgi:hypothetical protein
MGRIERERDSFVAVQLWRREYQGSPNVADFLKSRMQSRPRRYIAGRSKKGGIGRKFDYNHCTSAMALGYDFYPDIGLLFIRGQGAISQAEYMHAMLAWLRDPYYEDCIDSLIDFAAVKSPPTIRQLRELIAMLKQQLPLRGPRRIALVTSTPITFAVGRVFEHLVRLQGLPLEVKVFMNLRRAWKWLRPDGPSFQPR